MVCYQKPIDMNPRNELAARPGVAPGIGSLRGFFRGVMDMAGDWIKIEHWTPDKPEVFRIADALGIDPDAVVGKLVRIWNWADQQTFDGNAESVTSSLLDRITGVNGFATALEKVGWVRADSDGLHFVNFDRHNGKTAKTRALSTKRVQKHRESVTEMKRDSNDTSVTPELPEKRREEKRREEGEEKKKSKKKKFVYSEEFERWWMVYPIRESKALAAKAYQEAIERIVETEQCELSKAHAILLERTKALLPEIEAKRLVDKDYRKLPATWLNQGCYDDEPRAKLSRVVDVKELLKKGYNASGTS